MKNYPVIIEQDEDGFYIVSCPLIQGCHSYGASINEAMDNIREAIEASLDDSNENKKNVYIGYREIGLPEYA
jgi:predicted RNase H-like HicB family nuclease